MSLQWGNELITKKLNASSVIFANAHMPPSPTGEGRHEIAMG